MNPHMPLTSIMGMPEVQNNMSVLLYCFNYRCQPVPVLVTRLGGLAKEYRTLSKKVDRLKERIALCCEASGIEVDDDMHKDLKVNCIAQ